MQPWTPNLDWITPELAVGGSFPTERAEHLARELGVGAVVDLRAEACDDEEVLRRHGLVFLHLPTLDMHAVSPAMLAAGVDFCRTQLGAGRKLLIHCEHGIGRSALLALCVLVDAGMAPLEALELAKARRALVSPSMAQYEAWSAWLLDRGIEPPGFEAFAAVAYRHLR
ncbi:MAG: dual specificity protein phosphatase family protein [Pseudomonadota bacterium]|nr:dual specificity protein phosphatase family protein [Pseudomonadota bacterium]